jgi:hypothetical protein
VAAQEAAMKNHVKLLASLIASTALTIGCTQANTEPPTGSTGDWQTLLSGGWTINAGEESYMCVRLTATEDRHYGSFRPISPTGTHHAVLTVSDKPNGPDGTFACDAAMNGDNMLYGSGVGTNEFSLPPGVAIKVRKGQQLLLNLHLMNTSGAKLSGTSGVEIKELPASQVVHEAGVLAAGKMAGLVVDMGKTTVTGTCTLPSAGTIGAVLPHMHELGSHMAGRLQQGTASTTLHDASYDFDEQRWYSLAGQTVAAGDKIKVDCSYDNNRGKKIYFGESTTDEMCFLFLAIWPKPNMSGYYCTK